METLSILEKIKSKYPIEELKKLLSKLKNIKTLVIGDTIIDEYHFIVPKGRAIKDPIMSVDYVSHDIYPGGILAIANNVSNYVDNVDLITLLGDHDSREDYIGKALNKNVATKFFFKQNSPTTVKRRYVDNIRRHKLFKVEYINDLPISKELELQLIAHLKMHLPKYDLVIVGDFGHGFINKNIIKFLEENSKHLSVNVQTNSTNYGFNFITKYSRVNFTSMDELELKLALTSPFEEIDKLIFELAELKVVDKILITLGSNGCIYTDNSMTLLKCPILTRKVVDTVGAGDAVFSIISLLSYIDAPDEVIPFIANCVGGIAVNILCNKESVTKEKLLAFIGKVYDGMEPI